MQIPTLVIVVLALAILGSFLAYTGDLLGRRMGKKRLRIGRLRPKHTAIAFTMITGALIPIITTFTIMAVSAPVRKWVYEGPRVVEMRDSLLEEVESQKNELTSISNAKAVAENALLAQQSQLTTLEQQIAEARANQEKLVSHVDELSKAEQALTAQVKASEVRLQKAEEDFAEMTEKFNDVTRQYNDTLVALNDQYQQSIRKEQELIELEKQLDEAKERVADAESSIADYKKTLEGLQKQASELSASNMDLALELQSKRNELFQLQQGLDRIIASAQIFRGSPVLIVKGQELARSNIEGGISREFAHLHLRRLIEEASNLAKAKGAEPLDNGLAASVQDRQRFVGENTIITITAEDQMEAWADAIVRSDGELVAIASAFYNFFAGDVPAGRVVPLDIVIYRNRLVYNKGHEILTMSLAGGRTENETVSDILNFVQGDLSAKVYADGVIPDVGGEPPIELPGIKLIARVVDQVQRARGNVTISFVTSDEVRSGDRVPIEIRVKN